MTCIIGLETEEGAHLVGDSAAVGSYDIYKTSLNKVFANDHLLIGYTGSFRMGQLLEYELKVPSPRTPASPTYQDGILMPDMEYLVRKVAGGVRRLFNREGFAWKENERESGGEFLIAYRGRVYTIYSDYQVNRATRGYMASGSGEDFALGSLYTTRVGWETLPRLKAAMEAASTFATGVLPPFRYKFQSRPTEK